MIMEIYERTEYEIEESQRQAEEYEQYKNEKRCETESYDHWKNKIPHLIFKYRSVDFSIDLTRTIDILQNHRLFMSPAKFLNDPFEGGNVDYLSKDIELFEAEKKKCRILSLSENCFSAPLWAHYANNCRGVCIGFSTYKKFEGITPMQYTDIIDKKQWWACDLKAAIENEYNYKNNDWSYEREYRIIGKAQKSDESEKVYFDFEQDEIAIIILGEYINIEIKEVIIEAVPSACRIFNIKSDKNHSQYYLLENGTADEKENRIYSLDKLYDEIIK